MEQAIGMPVVGCFKQVSIITSNNAFTPARFPSIGLVLSALPVIPIDVFFFYAGSQPFSHGISPRGMGKRGWKAFRSHECIGQYLPAGREDESAGECSFAPFPDNI